MNFAEEYAIENNYKSIRLDAYSANVAAVRLYEKRGYNKIGQVFFPHRKYPFYCFEKIF